MTPNLESKTFISLHDIGRSFGATWALRNVSAKVSSGETVAVLGANGAGKSTLLKLLSGWYPCAEGHVTVDGFRMRTQGASVRRRLMLLDEMEPHEGNVVDTITQALGDYRAGNGEVAIASEFTVIGLLITVVLLMASSIVILWCYAPGSKLEAKLRTKSQDFGGSSLNIGFCFVATHHGT